MPGGLGGCVSVPPPAPLPCPASWAPLTWGGGSTWALYGLTSRNWEYRGMGWGHSCPMAPPAPWPPHGLPHEAPVPPIHARCPPSPPEDLVPSNQPPSRCQGPCIVTAPPSSPKGPKSLPSNTTAPPEAPVPPHLPTKSLQRPLCPPQALK